MNFGAILKSIAKLFGQAGTIAKKTAPYIGPVLPLATEILKNNQQPILSKGQDFEALRIQNEMDRKNAEELRQQNAILLGQLEAERKNNEHLTQQNITLRGQNDELRNQLNALQDQLKVSHEKGLRLEKKVGYLWIGMFGLAILGIVLAILLFIK